MPSIQILQITLQALSAFAIAGGFLYTAFQFRAARKAQAVANFAKLVELQYQLRKIRTIRLSPRCIKTMFNTCIPIARFKNTF